MENRFYLAVGKGILRAQTKEVDPFIEKNITAAIPVLWMSCFTVHSFHLLSHFLQHHLPIVIILIVIFCF